TSLQMLINITGTKPNAFIAYRMAIHGESNEVTPHENVFKGWPGSVRTLNKGDDC
ncbi:5721_t:CDS:1, partial [Funneliformis mosseae]